MIMDVAALAHSFKLGVAPGFLAESDPRKLHCLGEQLTEALDAAQGAAEAYGELESIRAVLVDYGALLEGDAATGLADVLGMLLPPIEGE